MSDTNVTPITPTELPKVTDAKNVSKWAQIVAAFWIAGWSSYDFIVNPEKITTINIIISGFAIAACFIAVYFNIIMDKIKDIKLGKME